jgi:hypothetical protein
MDNWLQYVIFYLLHKKRMSCAVLYMFLSCWITIEEWYSNDSIKTEESKPLIHVSLTALSMSDRNKAWLWRRGLWCMYCNDIKIHIRDKGCQVYYTEIQRPINVIDSLFKHITYDNCYRFIVHLWMYQWLFYKIQQKRQACVLGRTW